MPEITIKKELPIKYKMTSEDDLLHLGHALIMFEKFAQGISGRTNRAHKQINDIFMSFGGSTGRLPYIDAMICEEACFKEYLVANMRDTAELIKTLSIFRSELDIIYNGSAEKPMALHLLDKFFANIGVKIETRTVLIDEDKGDQVEELPVAQGD